MQRRMTARYAERSWPQLIETLLTGRDLTPDDTAWALRQVMCGEVPPARLAGMLVALRAKGEVAEEIEGLLRTLYEHAVPLPVPGPVLDIVGTGGDRSHSVNLSTMAAIVAAGAGARVVKHGGRAASSACGSADVLEELGVVLDLPPACLPELFEETGLIFCFAPVFHPALRHAAPVRRELGVPTVFNLLGPLANPARPAAQTLGVADPRFGPLAARVLARRGTSGLVVRGDDGMDELTVTTTSTVWTVSGGEVTTTTFDPREVGIPHAGADALRGGDRRYNARVARDVLAGERGPVRDAVLLSAAAGLASLRPDDRPVAERIAACLPDARLSIDSGAAAELLDHWVRVSREMAAGDRTPVFGRP
ncbi:anthranilate phosphoribosyltransferase [Streptomyces tricolor]|uniref:anthranilate phosphoribosyltransferase n=1 Tax=Streptomyces tricolor TaxID=68277 RepID=UPI00382194ED